MPPKITSSASRRCSIGASYALPLFQTTTAITAFIIQSIYIYVYECMYVCIYVKKNSQGDFRLMSFTAGRCSTPLIPQRPVTQYTEVRFRNQIVCVSKYVRPSVHPEVLRGDLNGFLVSKITFESTFLFYFFEFYLLKKVTKPYKSIFTSISRVFRVNQVFFSSRGPPFLHKLQTLRPTHSRSQNAEHTSCEVSIDRFSVKRT